MSLTDSIPWVCHFSYFMGRGVGLEDFGGDHLVFRGNGGERGRVYSNRV